MPNVVSLFSGCGGLDWGFRALNFKFIYACDSDRAAVNCYARNLEGAIGLRDVTTDEFKADLGALDRSSDPIDVVLGGFPCQGFSKAGPKQPDDDRNQLYREMLAAIARLRPRIFLAENVDGLSQNFAGLYLQKIIQDCDKIGYQIQYRILDAAAYGVPQHRRRIFFIGIRQPCEIAFQWPSPTHSFICRNGEVKLPDASDSRLPPVTLKDAIADLISLNSNIPDHRVTQTWPSKYQKIFQAIKPGQKLCNVRRGSTSVHTWEIPEVFGQVTPVEQHILETISQYRRHKKYGNLPNGSPLPLDEIEKLSGFSPIQPHIASLLAKRYLKQKSGNYDLKGAMFCSGSFKRPDWHEPAPTVLTNFYNPRYFLHPSEPRPFSLRECARIQGFPDNFTIVDSPSVEDLIIGYRLIGNAVPPPLSQVFAAAILQFLKA